MQCPLPQGTTEGENLCHCHKSTHQSRVDFSQSEIPLPAYSVAVSRVTKPFVVVSYLIQRVFPGCCKTRCCFFQMMVTLLHHTQTPRNSLGARMPCCCVKQCPGSHRIKGQHTASSGTTLSLIHKVLSRQAKARETGKCSQGHN